MLALISFNQSADAVKHNINIDFIFIHNRFLHRAVDGAGVLAVSFLFYVNMKLVVLLICAHYTINAKTT